MSRELIKKLKDLRQKDINPNAEWVKTNREILLSQIKNTGASEDQKAFGERFWSGMSIFVPQRIVFNVVKPLAILLVVTVVGTSGWITAVDAAYEALPGDLLYPAKRIMEKTQAAATQILQDKNSQTKLHAEFAKRRASEIKKVVKSDMENKEDKLAETLVDLKKEIDSVSNGLEEVKTEKTNAIAMVETIKEVQKNTEKIKDDLKQANNDLITDTTIVNQELTDEISEAKQLNKDIEIKVVEVVVSKHLEAGSEITKETVAEVVGKALSSSMDELKTAQGEAVTVSGIIEGVKSASPTTTAKMSTSTAGVWEMTSSTPEEEQALTDTNIKIDTVSNQAKQAVEKTATASQEADKKISEVKEILQTGSITEIVAMVKQVAEMVKATDQTTADTIKAAQEIMPITIVEVTNESMLNYGVVNVITTTSTISTTTATTTATGTKSVN